jgi:hypothetical protein
VAKTRRNGNRAKRNGSRTNERLMTKLNHVKEKAL